MSVSVLDPPDRLDQLWDQFKQEGDVEDRNALVVHYSPLVKYVTGRVGYHSPSVDRSDLTSFGLLGLVDAVEKFDPALGNKFETYAVSRVRGAVLDGLRGLDWAPRSVRATAKSIEQAHEVLSQQLGTAPSSAQMANHLNVTVDEFDHMCTRVWQTYVSPPDALSYFDRSTLADQVADATIPGPEDASTLFDDSSLLGPALKTLSEREQVLVALYYFEQLTLAQIGQIFNVSEGRVCQMHSMVVLKLRTVLLPT